MTGIPSQLALGSAAGGATYGMTQDPETALATAAMAFAGPKAIQRLSELGPVRNTFIKGASPAYVGKTPEAINAMLPYIQQGAVGAGATSLPKVYERRK
jgi:hypothetical protein